MALYCFVDEFHNKLYLILMKFVNGLFIIRLDRLYSGFSFNYILRMTRSNEQKLIFFNKHTGGAITN